MMGGGNMSAAIIASSTTSMPVERPSKNQSSEVVSRSKKLSPHRPTPIFWSSIQSVMPSRKSLASDPGRSAPSVHPSSLHGAGAIAPQVRLRPAALYAVPCLASCPA